MVSKTDSPVSKTESQKASWFKAHRNAKRLQRKDSSNASSKREDSDIQLPESILRASPSHQFNKDYEIPAPPVPSATHPALRPPAARHASSNTGRVLRSISSVQSIRPTASTTSLGATNVRPRSPNPANATTVTELDRPQHTPPLPVLWTVAHDRAICVLDARGYTLQQSIRKLRRAFPELIGCVVTPFMIDKRLRVLDQIPEVDYFKVGLNFSSKRSNLGGDTTVLENNTTMQSIASKKSKDSTPLRKKRSGRGLGADGKENRPLAISPSVDKIEERPSSMGTLDDLILAERQNLSAVSELDATTDRSSPSRRAASSKPPSLSKVNTTPFGDGYVSVRTSNHQVA